MSTNDVSSHRAGSLYSGHEKAYHASKDGEYPESLAQRQPRDGELGTTRSNGASMASEWYVEDNDRAIGPFSVSQMKAQAAAGRIKPDTRVRKGKRGKWIAAKQVQGLHAPRQSTEHAADTADTPATTPTVASGVEEGGTFLAPLRRRKWRLIIFVLLVLFILAGQAAPVPQITFDLCMGFILGSYPIVEVKKKTIEQTLFVFFFPVHKKVYKLRDFVAVEADVETRITQYVGCLILFVFFYWLLFRIFDRVMPWLGGDYKLWLRRYDDERIIIWQGNNTTDYEANLALLESAGLRIN